MLSFCCECHLRYCLSMGIRDFNAQRLFVDHDLSGGEQVLCEREQANYLNNVLRLGVGAEVRVFNGREGEWLCRISAVGKRSCVLDVEILTRHQEAGPDIDYYFAPLKRARLDYVVQKATELGVRQIKPVITHRTIVDRVNMDRMRANVIEAAEQCGILRLPVIEEPGKLMALLSDWPAEKALVVCDEAARVASPMLALEALREQGQSSGCGVLIGPEGGFSADERERLLEQPFVLPISLGPRIMRADTAAVAALSVLNCVIGDWQ